jgi:hypothetical protein
VIVRVDCVLMWVDLVVVCADCMFVRVHVVFVRVDLVLACRLRVRVCRFSVCACRVRLDACRLRVCACPGRLRVCACIGCPTSGVAQRAMRQAAPHTRGVSKIRQSNSKKVGCSQKPINCSKPFLVPLLRKNGVKLGCLGSVA